MWLRGLATLQADDVMIVVLKMKFYSAKRAMQRALGDLSPFPILFI